MEDASIASNSQKPKTPESRHTSRPSSVKNVFLVIAILVVFTTGVFLAGGFGRFVAVIYDPVALAVAALLFGQYVLLKGRDRSRLYRIELDRMREKRAEDLRFLQGMAKELEALEKDVATIPASSRESRDDKPGSYVIQEICARIHDLAAHSRRLQ